MCCFVVLLKLPENHVRVLINKLNFTNGDWIYSKQNILVNIENNQPNEII